MISSKSSESLGNDAYEWLIAAITSFRIPTNSQISENKLAVQLGVSRTPVREALKRLESEGLVKRGDAEGTWQEASIAVAGAPPDAVLALAREFGQDAVFRLDEAGLAVVPAG